MKRIDTLYSVNGKFNDRDTDKGIPGTEVNASWLNAVQEELVNVIEYAGLELTPNINNQLSNSIARLVNKQLNLLEWKPDILVINDETLFYDKSTNIPYQANPDALPFTTTNFKKELAEHKWIQGKLVHPESEGSALIYKKLGIGILSFSELKDVETSYVGKAGFKLVINETEDGIIFVPDVKTDVEHKVNTGLMVFDTVAKMIKSNTIAAGTRVQTNGYHNKFGIGGSTYDIWDLNEYRTVISDPKWLPDACYWTQKEKNRFDTGTVYYAGGDHLIEVKVGDKVTQLVAKLNFNNTLWAGQCGLYDPQEMPSDCKLAGNILHNWSMQKATEFAKRQIMPSIKNTNNFNNDFNGPLKDGINQKHGIVLHIEIGNYYFDSTVWVPANVMLCGGSDWAAPRCVDFIPLKPKYGGNISHYCRGFMFIFNGKNGGVTEATPLGSLPKETVYISPFVGGMSSINLNNYEEWYAPSVKDPAKPDWYKPDYLKGIKGSMVFGGGTFVKCQGNRMHTFCHRPGEDWAEFYTDGWEIVDYYCNTPLENDGYQIDLNGSGDAIRIDGCQFPVNHPSGTFAQFPLGEYPRNNPVKAIRLHNNANWHITDDYTSSKNSNLYCGAGMHITRCINGKMEIRGYRNVTIDTLHLEFGQLEFNEASAVVTNAYFSQVVGANYPSVICHRGQWGGNAQTLKFENCEVHRGFDGDHCPNEINQYDFVISDAYTVEFNNVYRGWDVSGSGKQEIGVKVGIWKDTKEEEVIALPYWTRWNAYLSRNCLIQHGNVAPVTKTVYCGSYNGINAIYDIPSNDQHGTAWNEKDGTYYYFSQLLLDAGNIGENEENDPTFIPLGFNQKEQFNSDGSRKELSFVVKPPVHIPSKGIKSNRPSLSFWGSNDTQYDGIVRLYRGTSPYQYDKYIDIPCMNITTIEDQGKTTYGIPWKDNTVPVDTNVDITKRIRNTMPVSGELDTEYELIMRCGTGVTVKNVNKDITDWTLGSGTWRSKFTSGIVNHGNNHGSGITDSFTNVTNIWDTPFKNDVYCNLPCNNSWNWDNSKQIKVKAGSIAYICRDINTSNNWNLIIQESVLKKDSIGNDVKNIAHVNAGNTVLAVYTGYNWSILQVPEITTSDMYSIIVLDNDKLDDVKYNGMNNYIQYSCLLKENKVISIPNTHKVGTKFFIDIDGIGDKTLTINGNVLNNNDWIQLIKLSDTKWMIMKGSNK